MSSHSKDRALALVPAGAAVAAGARAAARQQRALAQWAAGGCIMRSEYTGYTRVYERTVLELNVLSCHACRAESPLIQRSTLHSTLHYTPFKQSVAWDLLMVCRWRAATISSYLSCASNETI